MAMHMLRVVDLIIGIIGTIALVLAAICWWKAASIDVPDNIDIFIGELQRAARWNAWAARAAVVGALCGAWTYGRSLA